MRRPPAYFRFPLLVVCASLLWARVARAQPVDDIRVSVITMSPGDPLFFRFGHNAILIRDARAGRAHVFNWGTFSFDEPNLISKFLRGRLSYWLSIQGLAETKTHYASENRWVVEQELALTSAQKVELLARIENNARPENRKYRYHYYRDNCSTRVRDMIDVAVGGRLRAVSGDPARMTFRGQTSRLTAQVWWGHLLLNLAMGDYIDQPITEWDEMFVPDKVREMLRKVRNVNESGNEVPLVTSETLLVASDRVPPPERPPRRAPIYLVVGLLVGAYLGVLGYRLFRRIGASRPSWKLRFAFGVPVLLLSSVAAFLGSVFAFFWTLTDHEVAYANENLLQTSPVAWVLALASLGLLLGRNWAFTTARWAALVLLAMSALGWICKLLPWFDQANGLAIALFLPIWCGCAGGMWWAHRRLRAARSPS